MNSFLSISHAMFEKAVSEADLFYWAALAELYLCKSSVVVMRLIAHCETSGVAITATSWYQTRHQRPLDHGRGRGQALFAFDGQTLFQKTPRFLFKSGVASDVCCLSGDAHFGLARPGRCTAPLIAEIVPGLGELGAIDELHQLHGDLGPAEEVEELSGRLVWLADVFWENCDRLRGGISQRFLSHTGREQSSKNYLGSVRVWFDVRSVSSICERSSSSAISFSSGNTVCIRQREPYWEDCRARNGLPQLPFRYKESGALADSRPASSSAPLRSSGIGDIMQESLQESLNGCLW